MKHLFWVIILIYSSLYSATSFGNEVAQEDIKQAKECIEKAWDDHPRRAQNCYGRITDRCFDEGGNDTTAGQIRCNNKEYVIWDNILNDYYASLMQKTTPLQQKSLRDTQRLWIKYKDEKCHYWHILIEGTMASPMSTACASHMTFDRIIDFLGYINLLSM